MDNNEKREFGDDYFQDEKDIKTDSFGNSKSGSYEYSSQNQYGGNYQNSYGGSNENPYGNMNQNPYGGSSQNGGYGPNQNYRDYGQHEKKIGMGIASLVLGIISLVFFCSCFNIITGILAIIFGIIQLAKYAPHGKGLAIGGIITSVLSIILLVVFYVSIGSNTALQNSILDEYEDLYDIDLRDPDEVEKFLEDTYGESSDEDSAEEDITDDKGDDSSLEDGETLDDEPVMEYAEPL